jgi:BRCA1/BRCA2-containing complex subunit 3
MNIDQVKLSSDVFRGLLAHSFLTEHEEVLGLLYGSLSDTEILIWGSVNLIRNCKEKDRVEVDELQLSDAIHKAEEFSRSLKQATFLVGWFHSHPNITIFPSRVDLNTQRSLQSLGEHFVGLIISCFSRDASNVKAK